MFDTKAALRPRGIVWALTLVIALLCLGLTSASARPPEYTLTYLADTGGYLVGNTVQTVLANNNGTDVTAVAESGYTFNGWSDGSWDNPRTELNVVKSDTYTAYFLADDPGGDPGGGGGEFPNTYLLSYSAGEGGTLIGETTQWVDETMSGSAVEAVADPGYHFVCWDDFSIDNPRTDSFVLGDVNVTAQFAPDAPGPLDVANVISWTHPVASNWYSNNRPTFSWDMTSSVTYSWALDQNPTLDSLSTDPGAINAAFAPRSIVATGFDYNSVASGDVNHDGIADLVAAVMGSPSRVAVMLASNPGAYGAPVIYDTPTTYYDANEIRVADFNGDGWGDLVLTEHDPTGRISVMLNDGDGTFSAGNMHDYTTGGIYAFGLEVGDVNGDGVLDVVAANNYPSTPSVAVFKGNGDGTFQSAVQYAVRYGAYDLALADINGDGALDILTANQNDASVSLLLNNGDGTFPSGDTDASLRFATASNPSYLAVGDYNRDGHADVAIAHSGGSYGVSVMYGDGAGVLGPEQGIYVAGYPRGLAAADLNHDGYSDLVEADSSSRSAHVVLSDGTGWFAGAVDYAFDSNVTDAGLLDLNGDGVLEIVASMYSAGQIEIWHPEAPVQTGPVADGLWYLHARATSFEGTAGPVVTREVRVDVTKPTVALSGAVNGAAYVAGVAPQAVLTAHDAMSGVADLRWRLSTDPAWTVAQGATTAVDLPSVAGAYAYQYRATDAAGNAVNGSFRVFIFGDIAGLVSSTHPVQTQWYKNAAPALSWDPAAGARGYSYAVDHQVDGSGLNVSADPVLTGFTPLRQLDAGSSYPGVAVADFNKDGYLDVVGTLNSPSDVHLRFGNADGSFSGPVAYRVWPISGGGGGSYDVATGDFNGDTFPDLAVTVSDWEGKVAVLLNDGEGHFGAPTWMLTGKLYSEKVVVGDVTGDGKADIITADNQYWSSGISVFAGNGDGTFAAPRAYNTALCPWNIALGDMNGDGALDVVTADDTDSGTVSVLINNGDGTFPSPSDRSLVNAYPAGTYTMGLALADLDGDGRLDVATSDGGTNSLAVLKGNGDGTLQPMQLSLSGDVYGTRAIGSGDFNGDGIADLALVRGWKVFPLINDGSGSFPDSLDGVTGYDMGSGESVVTADLDKDGLSDIVVSDGNPQGFGALMANAPHVKLTGLADGLWYFHVRAVSGETGGPVGTRALRVDVHGPTFELSGSALGGAYLPGTAPDAVVTAADAGSGVASLRWKRSTDEGWTTPESLSASIVIPGAIGRYSYEYEATDVAGNSSHGSFAVTVFDGVTGLASPTHPQPGSWYSNNKPVVSWDPIVGVGYAHALDHDPTGASLGNEPGVTEYGFGTPVATDSDWYNGDQDIALVDLDHDGVKDIVGTGYNGAYFLQLFDMSADGTATYLHNIPTPDGSYWGKYTPQSLAVADLNGDGFDDLAVTLSGGSNAGVGVLINDGDGGFLPWVQYADGTGYADAIALGDVNGDGKTDVVCTNSSSGICVFAGNGDGTLQAAHTYPAGQWTWHIRLADFNNDGALDVVSANGDGTVSIALNHGDGTFPSSSDDLKVFSIGSGVSVTSLVAADLDGDGSVDLAVGDGASGAHGVIVMKGAGDGTLGESHRYGDNIQAADLVARDVNADGVPDLVIATQKIDFWGQYYESNAIATLLGDGTGAFQATATLYSTFDSGQTHPSKLVLSDVNGDGVLDAVVACEYGADLKIMAGLRPHSTSPEVADGLWYFHVRAVGTHGAAGSVATREVRVDTHAPTVDVAGLADGTYSTLHGTPQITLTGVDPGMPDAAGAAEIHYMISSNWSWQTVASGVATIDLPTQPGGYTVYYYAVDAAGNVGTQSSINVQAIGDQAAPVVDVTGVTDGGVYLSGDAPRVTLTASDPGMPDASGLEGLYYYSPADGQYHYPEGDTVTFDLPTQAGSYYYWGYAWDHAGNWGYFSFTVTIVGDVTGLRSPSHPDSEMWYSNNSPSFVWDVQDGAGYSYAIDQDPESVPDVSPDPVANAGLLSEYRTYPAGSNPNGIASGDFNEDGHPDLVTANSDNNNVTVQINNGDGTFTENGDDVSYFDVGSNPVAVAVADFNGDEHLDIAVVNNGDSNVGILYGNGDGTFGEQSTYDTVSYPWGIAVGDFNGDGTPDLVLNSDDESTSFCTLTNNGDGFDEAQYWEMDEWGAKGVAVADFNHDGRDDVVASLWGGVCVATNDGEGSFASENMQFVWTDAYPEGIAAGDLNGDGYADIVLPDSDSDYPMVLWNDGDGYFDTDNAWYGEADYYYDYSAAIGDINGDGRADFVTANNDESVVTAWINDGDGGFDQHTFDADSTGYGVVATDLNGDGTADVATGNWDYGISVLLAGSPTNVVTGPLDDGTWYFHVRPIAGEAGGNTATMQVNIDTAAPEVGMTGLEDGGTYRGSQSAYIEASDEFSGVASVDWRLGDGEWTNVESDRALVTVPGETGTYEVGYRATDNAGNVSDVQTFTVTIESAVAPLIDITNLTSPTHPDSEKWYSNPSPQFSWDSTRDAEFAYSIDQDAEGDPGTETKPVDAAGLFSKITPYQMGVFGLGVGIADFDEDGHPDIALADYNGDQADIMLNDGHGSYFPASGTGVELSGRPMGLVVADMNGDGHSDLVVGLSESTSVAVLYGDGTGSFGEPYYIEAIPDPATVAVGDFNHDGTLDIAASQFILDSTQSNFAILTQGDDGWSTNVVAAPTQISGGLAVGDLNGDGYSDVALGRVGDGDGSDGLLVATNDQDGGFTFQHVNAPVEAIGIAIEDMDGDGAPDILASDVGSLGQLGIFYNNGGGSFDVDNVTYLPQIAPMETTVNVADINGDGIKDIITSTFLMAGPQGPLSVWVGRSDGTYAQREDYPLGTTGLGVATGDLNGDGIADIAVSAFFNESGGVILLTSGSQASTTMGPLDDGTYFFHVRSVSEGEAGTVGTMQVNIDTHAPEIGMKGLEDGGAYTGSQETDIFAHDEFSGVASIEWRIADGEWTTVEDDHATVEIPGEVGSYKVSYRATDNAGNVSDEKAFTVTIFDGITGLDSPTHPDEAAWYPNSDPKLTWDAIRGARYSYVFDHNPSSDVDAVADPVDMAYEAVVPTFPTYRYGGVAAADFNHDGLMDVVGTTYSPWRFEVSFRTEAGTYDEAVPYPVDDQSGSAQPGRVYAGDFNNDGWADIAITSDGWLSDTCVYLNQGDGTFGSEIRLHMNGYYYGNSGVLGDVNGDGNLDIVVATHSASPGGSDDQGGGEVGVFLGNGDGTFADVAIYPTALHPTDVALADMNGDHALDILTVSDMGTGRVSVLLNDGDGTFPTPDARDVVPQFNAGTDSRGLAVADFDGDGNTDVATIDAVGQCVDILRGNGDGTLQDPESYLSGAGVGPIATGDLNGDHRPDLVLNRTVIALNDGDGGFASTVSGLPGIDSGNGIAIIAADMNGDGVDEAVTTDHSGFDILMESAPSVTFPDSADGTWYFHVRAIGTDGSLGSVMDRTVLIDTTAPSVELSGVTDGETYTTPQQAVLHATDELSGVAGIEWMLGESEPTYVESDTVTIDVPTEPGTYTYSYCAIDNTDNTGDWQSLTVTIEAPAAPHTHTLTYLAGEGGSIEGSATQVIVDGAECTTVTAVSAANHHFVAWSDGVLTAARCDTTAEGDLAVTAMFAMDTRTLVYTAEANGSIVGSSTQVVDYGSNGTTVTAQPAASYRFVAWSDGVLTAERRDLSVTASMTVSATFELTPVAHDDTATAYGRRVFVTPLSNDDPGVGSIATFTQGGHGAVARLSDVQPTGTTPLGVNGYNTLSYTPVADFVGTDRFTYTTSGGMTATVTIEVLPNVSAPTSVEGDKASATAVDVSWDAPASFGSGFAQYTVLWRTEGLGDWNSSDPIVSQDVTHLTIDGLTAGVTYEFKVQVTDTGAYSAASAAYSFLLQGDSIEPVAPPVTTHGEASATITIGGVDPDATLTVLPGASGVSTYTVDGLSVHVTPEPGFSGVIDVTLLVTDNGVSSTIHAFITVNPADPYAVTFGPVSASKTRVQWAGSPNATSYRIYVAGVVVGTVGPDASSFDLAGLLGPNAVVAVQAVGDSGTQSAVVRGTYLPGAAVRLGTITFAGNSAVLTAKAKTTLRRLARLVAAQGFTTLTINGFTAKNAHGSAAFRKRLSAARGAAVKKYLTTQFAALHVKVKISVFAWGGKGATNLPKFRRAEIDVR